MADLYTYADYITLAGDEKITRLKLHIVEVSQLMDARLQSRQDGYDPQHLVQYRKDLITELLALDPTAGGSVAADDPRVTSGFTRGRAAT